MAVAKHRGIGMSIYEEMADVFMSSLAAQVTGLTREQFIASVRAKWPDENTARKMFVTMRRQAEQAVERAKADAAERGCAIVGVAVPVAGTASAVRKH